MRLRFKVTALSDDNTFMLVCKNLPPTLRKGSDLRKLIEGWLGPDFIKEHTKK